MPFAWLMLLLLLLAVVPLLVGRAWQRRMPAAAPKLGRLLGVLSIVFFIIATITAGKYKMPTLKSIGLDGIVAIVALILCAWAVGWLLGGPEIRNRKVLAIGTSMRNVGVCYAIAAHYFAPTSSADTPANWSVVMLRTQLPEVWLACISTEARSARMSGTCSSSIQLYWMFWRVEKWP